MVVAFALFVFLTNKFNKKTKNDEDVEVNLEEQLNKNTEEGSDLTGKVSENNEELIEEEIKVSNTKTMNVDLSHIINKAPKFDSVKLEDVDGLSEKIIGILKSQKIHSKEDADLKTDDELLSIKGIGKKTLALLRKK